MLPVRDVIPSRTTPWVALTLLGVNAAASIIAWIFAPDLAGVLIVAPFVHTGWLQLLSNLGALWIFGETVEDRMGHVRFLIFYVLAGTAAALAHAWASPAAGPSVVGASGSVAGIIGAYLVLFPQSRILVLVVFVMFLDAIEVPAVFVAGAWLFCQALSALGDIAAGGPAVWTLVGGFLTGAAAVRLFRRRERLNVTWWND